MVTTAWPGCFKRFVVREHREIDCWIQIEL